MVDRGPIQSVSRGFIWLEDQFLHAQNCQGVQEGERLLAKENSTIKNTGVKKSSSTGDNDGTDSVSEDVNKEKTGDDKTNTDAADKENDTTGDTKRSRKENVEVSKNTVIKDLRLAEN